MKQEVEHPPVALSDFDRAAYFDGVLRGTRGGTGDLLRVARIAARDG